MTNHDNILWFCRTSDSSSLSRITDSVLPLLKNNFDITLLSNKSNLSGIKNVVMGADTEELSYKEFMNSQPKINYKNKEEKDNANRVLNMKYILVQIVDLIYDNNFKYLVLCNGVYEIDWFVRILTSDPKFLTNKNGIKTKLIIWVPIDYIPTRKVIENANKADLFLTMTPVMLDEIKKLSDEQNNTKFDYVGHGSEITVDKPLLSRPELIVELNKLRSTKLITCKEPIKETDIIILNANNNYGVFNKDSLGLNPKGRKRLDITIRAFMKIMKPGIKLWIHTNLKSFFDMLASEEISLHTLVDNIILSNNNLSNEHLSLIYQISQISLQTSNAEGWSLTNMEAALYRSLQVVPDFLACGWHFSNDRGILIPVTRKTIQNECGYDVIVGEVSVESTSEKLLEAIELLDNPQKLNKILDSAYEYSKSYTWSSIANKLTDIINNF